MKLQQNTFERRGRNQRESPRRRLLLIVNFENRLKWKSLSSYEREEKKKINFENLFWLPELNISDLLFMYMHINDLCLILSINPTDFNWLSQ